MVKITRSWLRSRGACQPAYRIFIREFGHKASVGEVVDWLYKINRLDWLDWLWSKSLTRPAMARAIIERISDPADLKKNQINFLTSAIRCGYLDLVKIILSRVVNSKAAKRAALLRTVDLPLVVERAYCSSTTYSTTYKRMARLLIAAGVPVTNQLIGKYNREVAAFLVHERKRKTRGEAR